jgi:anti-sigma B factor antagonist
VIDVENVEFLDSTGVGVLVGALKKVRSGGGTLDIVCTQPRLLKIFDITGLDKVFGLHTSVSEAVSS